MKSCLPTADELFLPLWPMWLLCLFFGLIYLLSLKREYHEKKLREMKRQSDLKQVDWIDLKRL